ncbi:hypothetical protein DSECCO2_656130 [anaerobic digester metagenome]
MFADGGMDEEGEVHGRAAFGQFLDFALGGEDVDLVLEEIEAQVGHEFARVLEFALPVHDLAQPGEALDILGIELAFFAFFVFPVRGHTFFGEAVHFHGADLDFDALAVGSDDGGMQALVHVGLGHRNVVFEAPGHGFPEGVHEAEHGVAFADGFDDDAKRHEVVDLVDGQPLDAHLVEDAPEVFAAAEDAGADVVFAEHLLDLADDALDVGLVQGVVAVHPGLDLVVDVGF